MRSTSPSPATTTCTTSATARRSSSAAPTARSRRSTTPASIVAPSSSHLPRWASARSCAARSTAGRGISTASSSTCPASGTSRTSAPTSSSSRRSAPGYWGGFVFVNFDDCTPELVAPPLEEYLGVLPEHFAELGSRRSLRRGAHPQEAAGELEGVGRSVPRGVPHPRNAQSVDLHRRRRQRPVRRVRRQRHPLHPHDRARRARTSRRRSGPTSRRCSNMLMGAQEPRPRGADDPRRRTSPRRVRPPHAAGARRAVRQRLLAPVGGRDDRLDRVLPVPERVLLPRPADPALLPVPTRRTRPRPLHLRGAVPATEAALGQGARAGRAVRPRRRRQLHHRARAADVARAGPRPGHDEPRRADPGLQVEQEARPDARQLPGGPRPPLPDHGSPVHHRRTRPTTQETTT